MILSYWPQLALLVLFSYFTGNFCAAIFISGTFIHKDIRQFGSKNPGTTNMTRVFGLKYGAATLLIDFFKGFICALVGKLIFTAIGGADLGLFAGYLAGLAVILGHNYPVLLGFKGGKGFATGLGIYIALNTVFTLILILIGIVLLFIIDRVSVLALTFFFLQAVYHFITYSKDFYEISLITFVYLLLTVISHWPNIKRLARGEEKPLGIRNKLRKKK